MTLDLIVETSPGRYLEFDLTAPERSGVTSSAFDRAEAQDRVSV